MKIRVLASLLLGAMSVSGTVAAMDGMDDPARRHLSPPHVLADLFLLRPTGLVLTVLGTGVLVGATPLIAIAQAAPPHDAFARSSEALVLAPAAFTFVRPLGYYGYRPGVDYDLPPSR